MKHIFASWENIFVDFCSLDWATFSKKYNFERETFLTEVVRYFQYQRNLSTLIFR